MTREALDYDTLPEDAAERSKTIEIRSRPDPDKPKLSPDREARLAGIEEQSAACYAQCEELTFRLKRAAKRINDYVPRYVKEPVGLPRADTEG